MVLPARLQQNLALRNRHCGCTTQGADAIGVGIAVLNDGKVVYLKAYNQLQPGPSVVSFTNGCNLQPGFIVVI